MESLNKIGFTDLLMNNILVVVKNISSFFFLGIPALLNLFFNGFVFGSILKSSVSSDLVNKQKMALLIFPHAILEFLGQILSAVIAMEISFQIIKKIAGSHSSVFPKTEMNVLLKLAVITFLLTIVAAWIETQITFQQI